MGIRRERPPVERSDNSIKLRFPDGSVKTMPVKDVHRSAEPALCCFCGEVVADPESERIQLSARWLDAGQERTQSWSAHHSCLADRMHGSVSRVGPFFGAEPD